MKQVRIGVIAAAVLAVTTVAWAQKPDFSGTWTLDADASTLPAGGGGGGGRGMGMGGPMTVKQSADTLTIERQGRQGTMTTTYKLDGSESVNTMAGRGGTTQEVKSVAKWDGSKLVIATSREMGGQTVETTETWSVTDGVLTIESKGGRGPSKRVYKKS